MGGNLEYILGLVHLLDESKLFKAFKSIELSECAESNEFIYKVGYIEE